MGLIYLRNGKLDESIEELRLIVSAWPNDNKSRFYLATAYEEKGDLEKALFEFKRIKPETDYFVESRIHMAHILNLQEKYDAAIKTLEEAIGFSEKRPELYLMLASVYETMENYDKAMAVIEEGLKIDERNVDLLFRLAILLDKKGEKENCLKKMYEVIEIEPDNADALNYIGYTYAEQGIKLDKAMELVQKALKIKPESGYIIDSLGWIYFQKGDYDKAMKYLQKAAELTGDDPTVSEHLGDVYAKKKKYKEALKSYEKALSLKHPDENRLKNKIKAINLQLKKNP